MLTADSLPRAGGRVEGRRHAATLTVAGRADELPAGLPAAAVGDVQGDVEEREALELAGAGERADVDRVEADRRDELEDRGLGRRVVAGDVAVELDALGDRVGLVRGEQGVERLDDVRRRAAARRAPRRSTSSCRCPGRSAPNDIRLVDVDDGLAGDGVRDLGGDVRRRWRTGSASTTTSAAAAAASAFEAATARPVAAATLPASSGSREAMMTVWPARTERGGEGRADVAGADDGDVHWMDPPMA